MRATRLPIRGWLVGFTIVFAFAAPGLAVERWGRVKSVDTRFQKFVVVQDGSKKEYEIRINSDTSYVMHDGRTALTYPLDELQGQRVYAIVEESPGHYASKIWLRPDVPPERDPVNPGVGAVLD
jgi:hypothetical protein